MSTGWIKLHRSLQTWGWRKSPNHTSIFLDLLLEANHEEREYLGVKIPKGSLTTSIKAISTRTGIKTQSVRTVLNKLKSTNEITIKTTTQYTMISITNWDEYQITNNETNKPLTNDQQTANKPLTTNKNSIIKEFKEGIHTPITPDEVVNLWNQEMGSEFGHCAGIGVNKHLQNFLESAQFLPNLQAWSLLFFKTRGSSFLRGENDKGWKVSLTWLVDYDNALKVLSGSFSDEDKYKHLFSALPGGENG